MTDFYILDKLFFRLLLFFNYYFHIGRLPIMSQTIRWGILSTGTISTRFVPGLAELPQTELVAVASRSIEKANSFADRFNIRKRHGSYQALADDPEVDVVYVSTPHNYHKEHSLLCLNSGKAVLCEKPFAINAQETEEMFSVAKEKGLFIMEAMWTYFLPHIVKLRELIAQGVIGDIRMLQADIGFRAEFDPKHRLFDPALGGGSLLDIGVYPVALAFMLFGPPIEIQSSTNLGSTGVDEETALLLKHSEGQLALLSATIRLEPSTAAIITGTKGRIHIRPGWYHPSPLTIHKADESPQTVEVDCLLNGMNYEALEVNGCLREGRLESEVMPHTRTLEIMKTLDRIRAQWGLKYPMEE